MRICVIFNPAARGEKAKRFFKYLDSQRDRCALKPTVAAGDARALAAEAVREGFDTIVAAGGDGTVNEVLNGLGEKPEGFQKARLGILPLGTCNVFAREIGLPLQVQGAWETILRGRERIVDLAQVKFDNDGNCHTRYFMQMVGFGWDARAVQLVNWELKKRFGQVAYMISGAQALQEKSPDITVSNNDTGEKVSGKFVIIGNGRFYAGEVPVFHRASLQDGLLDVCVFPRINWMVLARYVLGFFIRRIPPGSEKYFQSTSIQLLATDRTPLQLDGEYVGHLPAACSVLPKVLRVITKEG